MKLTVTVLTALLAGPPAVHAAGKAPAKKASTATPATIAAPPDTAPSETPPPNASPMSDLKKSNASLKKVLQGKAPSWSPERDVRDAEVRKVVGNFLDFEELSRRALGKHWAGLPSKQRTDFVATLRDLVERNYIKQIHGQPNYDLRFDKESTTGGEASVLATLSAKPKGKKVVKIALEYKMVYKGGRWVVYDVVTDEQSLLENYRAEFNKIISRDGFEALLKRMKKRLNEQPA